MEEAYVAGNPKGKGNRKSKGKGKRTLKRRRGECQTGKQWNQDDTEHLPNKCHNCGKAGHKAAQCTQEKTKGRGKKGVSGVDDEGGEETSAENMPDVGDLEICAVGEIP